MTSLVLYLVSTLDKSGSVLRSASAKIDDLKTGQIDNQKRVMLLQDKVIKSSKSEQVVEVQATVKTDFKSFSDVVKQNSQEVPCKKLQEAVKSAVESDQRSRSVMEEKNTHVLSDSVTRIFGTVVQGETPAVKDCYRVGSSKPKVTRPMKTCFISVVSVATAFQN